MGQEHQTHRRTQDIFQTVEWAWRTQIQAQIHTHLSKNRLSFVNQGMRIAMINPFTVIFDEESGYQLRLFRPDAGPRNHYGQGSPPLSTIAQVFLVQPSASIASYATHSETGAAAS